MRKVELLQRPSPGSSSHAILDFCFPRFIIVSVPAAKTETWGFQSLEMDVILKEEQETLKTVPPVLKSFYYFFQKDVGAEQLRAFATP